jgi:hypothetical protein
MPQTRLVHIFAIYLKGNRNKASMRPGHPHPPRIVSSRLRPHSSFFFLHLPSDSAPSSPAHGRDGAPAASSHPSPLSSSSMANDHCPPPFDSPQTLTWNMLPPLAPPLAQTLNGVDIQQIISERLNLPWNEAGVVEKWAYQTFTISMT